jgi:hypothetical protein
MVSFMHVFANWFDRLIIPIFFTLLFISTPSQAEKVLVQRASLEADAQGGWNLEASFTFDVNKNLEDAINKGIPLYFTIDFKLMRKRWYWFDKEIVIRSKYIRLSYQPLMREYRVSGEGLRLGFSTLKDALALIKHITTWHVISNGTVSPGNTYLASIRMQLDTAFMSKPFQIDALNNRNWNLDSGWKSFTFTARARES